MSIAKMLPMAFVMIAGPQILTSILLATSEKWRQNSTAYVMGAALSITATITIAYFVGSDAPGSESSDNTIYVVILVLLLLAAHTFHTRKTAEPPKWMGELQSSTPQTLIQARVPASRCVPRRHPHLDRRRRLSLYPR